MQTTFFGWRVVAGAFVLATFGWGLGFYGPPVYMHQVQEERGWSTVLVSTAVTLHFLIGALLVANLPGLYKRFGLPAVTRTGTLVLALGVLGWALAREPWQLLLATLFSGAGWVTMAAAAINAIVAPWFAVKRPAALAMAYNGASIGGVVFSPLWVAAIGSLGFPMAAFAIGIVMVITVWILCSLVFAKTPRMLGQVADGEPMTAAVAATMKPMRPVGPGGLWRDWRFLTLAGGMALGLFAQIGLIAHLFSLLVPALGEQLSGLVMGASTAAAIGGRTLVGWLMPPGSAYWLALLIAPFVGAAFGLLIEWAVIRRLYHRPLDTILATFGVSLILQKAIELTFGALPQIVVAPAIIAVSNTIVWGVIS
ncbi:MAG: MFS transporter, partial [Enhydrobacter sp.]